MFDCDWTETRNLNRSESVRLYTGRLIEDLISAVYRAEQATASSSGRNATSSAESSRAELQPEMPAKSGGSEAEEFSQALRLCPADWNLALLLIIHAQLVRTLEPGHDFANAVDVHQIGTVRPPEQTRIQAR